MPHSASWRSINARLLRLLERRRFGEFGDAVYVFEGVEFLNRRLIRLASEVVVQRHCYLGASADETPGDLIRLTIGQGTNLGPRNHVFAARSVEIGKKVLTAPNVFVSDCTHIYADVSVPIIDQGVRLLSETSVGDNSWIGANSVILGCSVGKHCVVGANSVVLADVPDYCVVVGSPARIVRHFDQKSQLWLPGPPESIKYPLNLPG